MEQNDYSGIEMISTQTTPARRLRRMSYTGEFSVKPTNSSLTQNPGYISRIPAGVATSDTASVATPNDRASLSAATLHIQPNVASTTTQSSTLGANISYISLEQNSTLPADDICKPNAKTFRDVENVLASMPPSKRWGYLAREQRSAFTVFALATLAWLYSVMSSWAKIEIAALSLFSTAVAQENTVSGQATTGSLHMQDVLLILLSVFVVWSLGTVTFASSSEKIKQAGDTLKTILGFVVGYFSSGKST